MCHHCAMKFFAYLSSMMLLHKVFSKPCVCVCQASVFIFFSLALSWALTSIICNKKSWFPAEKTRYEMWSKNLISRNLMQPADITYTRLVKISRQLLTISNDTVSYKYPVVNTHTTLFTQSIFHKSLVSYLRFIH